MAWFGILGGEALLAADVAVQVTNSAGQVGHGVLQAWTAEHLRISGTESITLPMAEIATISFPEHSVRPVEGDWLILANGDRMALSVQRIEDDQVAAQRPELAPALRLAQPLLSHWNGPLESVAAFVFNWPSAPSLRRQWLADLENVPPGEDWVQFLTGDRLSGEVRGLDGLQVAVSAPFGDTHLDRRRIRWIRLDRELTSFPPLTPPYWFVWLTDGSRLTATTLRPGPNLDVELSLPVGEPVRIAWNGLVRVQQINARRVPLSARQPKSTTYTPYLSGARQLRVNRNVLGGPLSVRGWESAVGLGMCSAMSATYPVEPTDREFRAAVGIDDAAEGRGSARFRIVVDGRAVWDSGEITGRMPRVECPPVSLRGARELTLQVDFGAFGDVGDYANWCDTFIVREP
jgi:hypothetical protein